MAIANLTPKERKDKTKAAQRKQKLKHLLEKPNLKKSSQGPASEAAQ